jgi:thymidylate synthase (FAD)
VGRLSVDDVALAGFLSDEGVETWTTDAEEAGSKLVEVAGRLCYKSYARPRPGGNASYIGHILEVGHGSVIEHAVYNFIITGVSRSFTHELVRHRAGFAYSQRSQRFCDESDLAVVGPVALLAEIEAARLFVSRWFTGGATYREAEAQVYLSKLSLTPAEEIGLRWLAQMESSRDAYAQLSDYLMNREANAYCVARRVVITDGMDYDPVRFVQPEDRTGLRKKAREAARSVLPNATETQIFVTLNARAARHFIEMRGDESADAEIRRVALAMLRILQAESPAIFSDYDPETAKTNHRKV